MSHLSTESTMLYYIVLYTRYCYICREMDVVAGQLHALLDDPPWTPEGKILSDNLSACLVLTIISVTHSTIATSTALQNAMFHRMFLNFHRMLCSKISVSASAKASAQQKDASRQKCTK